MDLRSSFIGSFTAIIVVCGLIVCPFGNVFAEDPRLEIRIPELSGAMGELISIPVYLDSHVDTLDGYTISITLSRDDIMYFEVDTVYVGEDTIYVCQLDTSGTLTSGWQFAEARSIGRNSLDLRITALAELAQGESNPGIPPSASGVLVKFFGRLKNNIPAGLADSAVTLDVVDAASYYSDPHGQLIEPVLNTDGAVSVDVVAEDPRLEIRIPDLEGVMGELLTIPVYLDNHVDTLDGYTISITLSRDDIMYFEVDTVHIGEDTIYVCQLDTSGTLTSGWQFTAARSIGRTGLDLRITAMAELAQGGTPGIPPPTSGVLVKFFGRVKRNIPTNLGDSAVTLDVVDAISYYSDPHGQLIQPALNTDGSVSVISWIPGDLNCDLSINPTDCVYLVNFVYKNWDILCHDQLGDLNCDGAINPVDVVLLINYIYRGWPVPPCEQPHALR